MAWSTGSNKRGIFHVIPEKGRYMFQNAVALQGFKILILFKNRQCINPKQKRSNIKPSPKTFREDV
jgi:hypothetical protein